MLDDGPGSDFIQEKRTQAQAMNADQIMVALVEVGRGHWE